MTLKEELEGYVRAGGPLPRGCEHASGKRDAYVLGGELVCRECLIERATCCEADCGAEPVAAVVLSCWHFGTRSRQEHLVRPLCFYHAGVLDTDDYRWPRELFLAPRDRDGIHFFCVTETSTTGWPPVLRYDPAPTK